MKNAKELQAILTGILVLNHTAEKPNVEIDKLCKYAFQHCLEAPTDLLLLAINGTRYEEMVKQVNDLLRTKTKFHKTMGGPL